MGIEFNDESSLVFKDIFKQFKNKSKLVEDVDTYSKELTKK
jgi:hypothetical protein